MRLHEITKKLDSFKHFTGGKNHRFSDVTLATFYSLSVLGLTPSKTVLDIGCGALRNGFLLINYLEPNKYYGVEPNVGMLEEGKEKLAKAFLEEKKPFFSNSDQFDFLGSFGGMRFDYVLARSVLTHTSKSQMEICFHQLAKVSNERTIFLLSYVPPKRLLEREYSGQDWLGKSHQSDKSGIAKYKKETIVEIAERYGFSELPGFDDKVFQANQEWLILKKN